jgi:hypothetical protein
MNTYVQETLNDIKDIVNGTRDNRNQSVHKNSDVYQNLMQKEDKVINLLNDIHQHEKEKRFTYLMNTPLHLIVVNLITTLNDIMRDLYHCKTASDMMGVVLQKDRMVYTGMLVITFGLVMLLMTF